MDLKQKESLVAYSLLLFSGIFGLLFFSFALYEPYSIGLSVLILIIGIIGLILVYFGKMPKSNPSLRLLLIGIIVYSITGTVFLIGYLINPVIPFQLLLVIMFYEVAIYYAWLASRNLTKPSETSH